MVNLLIHTTNLQNKKVYKLIWLFLYFHGTFEAFYLNEEIELKRNQLVTILRILPKEYEISFEIKPTAFMPKWSNIIHLTLNSDYVNYGDRIYSIWMNNLLNIMGIFIPVNGESHMQFSFNLANTPLKEWTKIKATQKLADGKYTLNIYIAETKAYSIENNDPREFNNIKLYLGDPWYDAQPGFVRNLFTDAISDCFTIKEETPLVYNRVVGILTTLPKDYELSFEFKPTHYFYGEWRNIIHLTIGGNREVYGDRTSTVAISPDTYIQIASSRNGIVSSSYIYDWSFPLNTWTKVRITQVYIDARYMFTVKIAESIIFTEENSDAREFQNVKIYLSNAWVGVQPGYIRNLVITNAVTEKRNCSLVTNLSSNITNEEVYINVNITASQTCQINLENITIYLHHEPMLLFKRFSWDYLGLNATSIHVELKFVIIYVRKLFIESHIKFSCVYDINKKGVPLGKTNASVVVDFGWFEFYLSDRIFKFQKYLLFLLGKFSYMERSISDLNKVIPKCCCDQHYGAYFQSDANQYSCTLIHKRQQSFCFQQEIATGQVNFLPIQFLNIIGYDSKTNIVYGRTFRNEVVEMNFNENKPAVIISNERWSRIKTNIIFLSDKWHS